ncbi:uncharacterized protein LOC103969991 [Musa acuminata AAA Group]|uniref:uncharacterized protein LOC103969991 n=1 Tax=Musa acuminata AAA Group TaxID=214697 RepID=UPI0031DF6CB6
MEVRGVASTGNHLGSVLNKPSSHGFYTRMALFFGSCWFFVTDSLIWLFSFVAMHLFRIRKDNNAQGVDLKVSSMHDSTRVEPFPQVGDSYIREEKESPSLSFKFQYQFSDHHKLGEEQLLRPVANEASLKTSIRKYHFLSEKDYAGLMEEPEAKTCSVRASYVQLGLFSLYDDENISGELSTGFESSKSCHLPCDTVHTIDKLDGIREEKFSNVARLEEENTKSSSETNLPSEFERTDQAKFVSEEFSGFDSDTESLSASDGYSVKDLIVDSDSDDLLSEYNHGAETTRASIDGAVYKIKHSEGIRRLEEAQPQLTRDYDSESVSVIGKHSFTGDQRRHANISLDENSLENESGSPQPEQNGLTNRGEAGSNQVRRLDESKLPTSNALQMELMEYNEDELRGTKKQRNLIKGSDDISRHEDEGEKNADSKDGVEAITNEKLELSKGYDVSLDGFLGQEDDGKLIAELDELTQEEEFERKDNVRKKSKEDKKTEMKDLDDEDCDELESLWEHQDLIEQLKMELRRVRAIGLPTIPEASETPRAINDLKLRKMDEKFLHEDPMDELHKFYKCYRERMRKFDILNYQKMYAIGLLQLKDPLLSMGSQKSLLPKITSILSQSFWACSRQSGISPSEKFIKELQHDLEVVYVGQTCLSWEFLRWQYEKARQLPECDPYRSHQYNRVAVEFQQFQVMMQRFIEDEAFQGLRLPNYVKHRCAVENLLLVPVIREDSSKEKMEDQGDGNYIVTSEILEDIMEESIRIFWEFVKADKDETPGILKGLMGTHVELQDAADSELMTDIHSNLHKKEKKLKDILRTGNCLVKKFKKPKEDRSNQDIFFSQVDLKLVARVLRMSTISTDQLVWCHAKLSSITFTERKVQRESSFMLFPCW